MNSEANVAAAIAVVLNGTTVSVAVDAAKGSVVVNMSDGDTQVTLDSEKVERLRETAERLNDENIELAARAYAAERRVRELEARIESMKMDAKVEGYRHG